MVIGRLVIPMKPQKKIDRLQTTQPTRGGAVTAVWQTLCKLCRPLPPPAMGARLPFFWVSRPGGPAGLLIMLLIEAGDAETDPGPTTTRKQVWICDICHRQIQVRKQISIRCNRIKHWVHLRCTGIYTHNTQRHNTLPDPGQTCPPTLPQHHPPHRNQNIHISHVPPKLVKPKPNPVTHSPPTPPTPPQAKHIPHTPPTPITTL